MNILAIDTSNLPLSIAVITEERVLGEWTLNVERNHSIRLMPAIQKLLEDVRITPKEIDLFVVARGPGSYTGVRIGVTTAKSLAWTTGKPLVGVSSLLALAQQIPYFNGIIMPMFDARRDRVYTVGVEYQNGEMEEVISEQVLHIEQAAQIVKELGKPALLVGEDVTKYRDFFASELHGLVHFLLTPYHIPRAAHLAQLGYARFLLGQHESLSFAPTYLQATEAEVNLQAGKVLDRNRETI